jgi:uncharacterized membrane protein YkoI
MRVLAALLCALVLGAATPGWAQGPRDRGGSRQQGISPEQGVSREQAGPREQGVSRDQAAAVAQRANGGRVLSVDRTEADGRGVWRVKVLTGSGDVRVVLIDATTGRPL